MAFYSLLILQREVIEILSLVSMHRVPRGLGVMISRK